MSAMDDHSEKPYTNISISDSDSDLDESRSDDHLLSNPTTTNRPPSQKRRRILHISLALTLLALIILGSTQLRRLSSPRIPL